MTRSRTIATRSFPVLAALLACAQFVSLVGFPALINPSAATERCGKSCGCFTVTTAAPCCCSTGKKSPAIVEPESCCSKSKTESKSCCANKALEIPKTEIVWVVGLFARSCSGETGPSGLPAMEPAVPPMASNAIAYDRIPSDAVVASNANANALPSIPPDPPPRTVG